MNNVMASFKAELLSWKDTMQRAIGADIVAVDEEDCFTLIAKLPGKEVSYQFTREIVLGPFSTARPEHQRPKKRVCKFRDDFVRKVLSERGL